MPENDGGDLLLSNDFVRYCLEKFSVPSKGGDLNSRTILQKYLNIIDPLKENNNLGRSVSKGIMSPKLNSLSSLILQYNAHDNQCILCWYHIPSDMWYFIVVGAGLKGSKLGIIQSNFLHS